MKLPSLFRVLALGASILCLLPASAAPVTYKISGFGSGHIGSQSFSDAAFVFTGLGDTDSLVSIGGGASVNPLLSMEVTVSGHGAAHGLNAIEFYVNNTVSGVGFLDDLVGDIFGVLGAGLADFDGVSAFGPSAVDLDYLAAFMTTAGLFELDSARSLSFVAELAPTPVPAPASSWLAVDAMLALSWIGSRRHRTMRGAPTPARRQASSTQHADAGQE